MKRKRAHSVCVATLAALILAPNVRRWIGAEDYWLRAASNQRRSGRGRGRAPPHIHLAWRKLHAALRLPKARGQMRSSGVQTVVFA